MAKAKTEAPKFTPTNWDVEHGEAGAKERFYKQFVRFVEGGFRETMFPRWFYTRLSMTFGHIAHYNQRGFYETFFTSTADKLRFLEITARYAAASHGDPKFTYADVEVALGRWVLAAGLVTAYQARLADETQAAELAELRRLQEKYGGGSRP